MEKINWDVFKLEEKIHLKKMIKVGNYKDLAVPIDMNPDKENEIEKIRKDLEPYASEFESKVRKDFYKKNNRDPENPTEEAELQEAMRVEFEEYKAKLEKKRNKRIKRVKKEEPKDVTVENPVKKPIKKAKK